MFFSVAPHHPWSFLRKIKKKFKKISTTVDIFSLFSLIITYIKEKIHKY